MSEKRFLRKPGEDNYSHRKGEEIMTFFGITHEGLDQSFSSSSLSRDVDKTILCVQNFITIALSLKRVWVYTAGHTGQF
jgi:hypothetical protein